MASTPGIKEEGSSSAAVVDVLLGKSSIAWIAESILECFDQIFPWIFFGDAFEFSKLNTENNGQLFFFKVEEPTSTNCREKPSMVMARSGANGWHTHKMHRSVTPCKKSTPAPHSTQTVCALAPHLALIACATGAGTARECARVRLWHALVLRTRGAARWQQ